MTQKALIIPLRYTDRGNGVQDHRDGAFVGNGKVTSLISERASSKSGRLRTRASNRHALIEENGHSKAWQRRIRMSGSWGSVVRIILLVLIVTAIVVACFTLPIDKILNDFLIWIHKNLGPWGPVALALAYIPLTVLAVPASILTIGGGYLFGLPIGFLADSIGATFGATAAFLLGKTVGRSFVVAKLKDYPQFQLAALAIQRSGFKIVLLLRLVPLLPFNILNYLFSVTPVKLGEYVLASWIGMMPITFALVYVGTTIKDLSDVRHGWGHLTTVQYILLTVGLAASVVLLVVVTKVAKKSLNKAILESEIESDRATLAANSLPGSDRDPDLQQPLVIRIDSIMDSGGSNSDR
eukprot:c22904_g1_i1 orf=212-1270(-)